MPVVVLFFFFETVQTGGMWRENEQVVISLSRLAGLLRCRGRNTIRSSKKGIRYEASIGRSMYVEAASTSWM